MCWLRGAPFCKPALCQVCLSAAWLLCPLSNSNPLYRRGKRGAEPVGKWFQRTREEVARTGGQTSGPSAEAARPCCAACVSGSHLPQVPASEGPGWERVNSACAVLSFWPGDTCLVNRSRPEQLPCPCRPTGFSGVNANTDNSASLDCPLAAPTGRGVPRDRGDSVLFMSWF